MKRTKDTENEDYISEDEDSDDDDTQPPPRKVKHLRVDVDIPTRNVAETTPKLATVQVKKPPNIAILVQRPPSIWSRFRDICSTAKSSADKEHDIEPAVRNVRFAEATNSTGFPETRQDSPQIRTDEHPTSPRIARATCANSKRGASSPGPCGSDELSEESHSARDDVHRPAYSGSPKESVRMDEVGKCRCEAPPRIQRDTDSTAVARIAVDKHVKCRSYGLCRRLKDESNYLGLSIFNALPEGRNVCLSIYAVSFLVPLIDADATDSKASFRETLKFGALVAKEGGRLAHSCKEVLTTLRRRAAGSGEVIVNTEVYLRHYHHDCGTDSTQNATSHIMTAELIADDAVSETVWNDVLFNTASFENLWRCPFSKSSTYTGSFFNKWTDQVTVQVMRKTGVLPYSYYHDLEADVVCLPYADDAVSMVLIAQRSSSSAPVKLTPDAVRGFVHGAVGTLVTLHLPKFQLSTSIDMADIINEVASASYESERLHFLHLRQEGRFSVDEGLWPVVSSERTLYAGVPVTIVVNKPFYFVTTDRTSDLILYAGRVVSV